MNSRKIIHDLREERRKIDEKLAQGWTYEEATRGKGWEAKYPNWASWQGSTDLSGSDGLPTDGHWKISLTAWCGTSFHSTYYVLATEELFDPDGYRALDKVIKKWNDKRGEDAILRFKEGWQGEAGWENHYPNIANWIEEGKRHCIRLDFNLVTQQSYVKAWLYDQPTNTEMVVFEETVEGMTEHEVLEMLDRGIMNWISRHQQA